MNRMLLSTRLIGTPLLAMQGYVDVVISVLAEDLNVEPLASVEQMAAHHRATRYPMLHAEMGGIAVQPIVGSLMHRAGPAASMSATQGYTGTQNQLIALADSDDVKGIILDFDTPGGEVGGVHELGETIAEIAQRKPVWALANPLMASAGYWLGASASRVLATPYARVGSIGVVTSHIDMSKAMEKRGIAVTYIYKGAHKIDGHPNAPLPEEVAARWDGLISDTYDQFVEHVASRRGISVADVRKTEAGIFSAKEALELKLIDGISTLGQTIEQMRDHLEENRKTVVNIQRNAIMAEQAELEVAKAEGFKEGAAAERARITGILGHESAKDRGGLALELAATDGLTVETAAKILAKAAPEKVEVIPAKEGTETDGDKTAAALLALRANSPKVGGDEAAALDAKATRKAELAAMFGKKTAA